MNRRQFLKNGAILGAGLACGAGGGALVPAAGLAGTAVDMAAMHGGEPAAMFNAGIAALGGMERFVAPGQVVTVKPNMAWDVSPDGAANTNPELVGHIVERCYGAGAKRVYVFDHTCDSWKRSYKESGIERAVRDAGGTVVPADAERYYQDVDVPMASRLQTTKVHELVLEADVFINVPVLKHHGGAGLTMGMKNNMGIVWDRGEWHRRGLHRCIADFAAFRKPDLTVIDAYRMLKRNGPRGVSLGDVVTLKSQVITADPVAADAAGARLFGAAPATVQYIRQAHEAGLGVMDLAQLNIQRIRL